MFSMQPPNSGTAVRTCQRCGKPLSPNEVYCDNCGVYNGLPRANSFNGRAQPPAVPASMSWGAGASTPQTTYGMGQYGEQQQWGQASTLPASNSLNGGYSSTQQPFNPNNYYSSATRPPPSSSPNNYFDAPQQGHGYAPSSSPITGGFQPGSMNGFPSGFDQMPQPPARKKGGRKLWLIIGISVLVVVLVSGAFLGYAFLANKNGKTLSVTPTPAPTPTPSVTPLFKDSFDNNNNGWDLTSDPAGKLSVQVGGGKMVLEDDNNKLLWEIVPGKTFSNFALTVDAVLSKGDQNNGYGIYIRGGSSQDSPLGTYYRFELYGDGTYAIFKGVLNGSGTTQSTQLGYNANASIQKQGIVNHITIMAKGQSMTFMVNGQVLSKFTDNNYKSGLVALFVSNLPGSAPGAQATFSHLAIYPV